MTDADIIKALECCVTIDGCKKCPRGKNGKICKDYNEFIRAILDLINRQKAEIEKLQKHNSYASHKHYHDGAKDFAEKLKRECNGIISNDWNHKAQPVSWAAAYEEFIEDIDRLLSEMVGDES